MSDKLSDDIDFEIVCWRIAKEHFRGLGKEHIIRMIEYSADQRIDNEEMDS